MSATLIVLRRQQRGGRGAPGQVAAGARAARRADEPARRGDARAAAPDGVAAAPTASTAAAAEPTAAGTFSVSGRRRRRRSRRRERIPNGK